MGFISSTHFGLCSAPFKLRGCSAAPQRMGINLVGCGLSGFVFKGRTEFFKD
jgi:hypothetical protein